LVRDEQAGHDGIPVRFIWRRLRIEGATDWCFPILAVN